MQSPSNDFYDEVIEEEEYFEEESYGDSMGDEELLAFVKTSLQDEYRQRLGTTSREPTAKTSKVDTCRESSPSSLPVAIDVLEELDVTNDSTSVYEEIVISENSFTSSQGPTENFVTLHSKHEYSHAGKESQDKDRDNDKADVESIKSSIQKLALDMKPSQQEWLLECASFGSQAGITSEYIEEIEDEDGCSKSDYEEQVIERWFGNRDQEPENLEAACRVLIPIIYRGENVCADTMIRRTPLSELYKYLKQHYDYKKEIKKDLTEEETESETIQISVQELLLRRTNGSDTGQLAGKESTTSPLTVSKRNARLMGGSSPRKIRSPWGKGKKVVKMNQSEVPCCTSFDDSQVIYEEISITDFEDSCIVHEESESVFEEIVEDSESYDIEVVVEESVHGDEAEDDKSLGVTNR